MTVVTAGPVGVGVGVGVGFDGLLELHRATISAEMATAQSRVNVLVRIYLLLGSNPCWGHRLVVVRAARGRAGAVFVTVHT
jgi:hypothetical protein